MSKPTLHRSFGSVLTMAASAFIVTSSTHAALVGYENFDGYTAGNALNGLTGGAGWPTSSAWSAVSGVNVSSEAITYDLGGETLGGGTTVKMTANSTNALVRSAPVTGGKDVFVSFIFQIKGGTPGNNVTGTVFTGWQADDTTPSYTVDSIGYLGSSGKAGARINNQSTSFASNLKYGQTYLFVIKYGGWSNGAYQTTQVWLNPTRAQESTTDPAITVTETETTGGSSGFAGLRVRTYGLSTTDYYLADEIRIGTTWDDVVSPAPRAPLQFAHPGITVDSKDLARMRDRVLADRQPQAAAWSSLVAGTAGDIGYQAQVTPIIECVSGTNFSIHNDARALLDLALQWSVTGDEDYADTAIEVMDAWSGTLEEIRTSDAPGTYHSTHILHVAWNAHHFAEAAEIIRHTYKDGSGNPIWPADKIARFEAMLKDKFLIHLPNNTTQNGNWEASIIHSIMAIGIFTNDRAIFERAAVMLRGAGRGAIGTYIYPSGQCQETTRKTDSGGIDLLHPQMGIGDILQSCEMAWKQGADLYSAYPDPATGLPRMVLGMEYAAGLTLGEARPLDGGGTIQFTNPPLSAPHELFENGHNHYIHRIGYQLPWTAIAMKQRRDNNYFGHHRCALTHGDLSVLHGWSFATGGRTSLSTFNWSGWGALGSATATTYTATSLPTSSATPRLGIHNVAGAGGDAGVLFAHSGGTSTPTGSRNDRFVITADTGTLSVSPDGLNTIVWKQASSNPATFATRVLVKVSGQWYASAQTYTVTTASSSGSMTNDETKIHDLWGPAGLGTTEWRAITFGNGQAINLSGSNVSTAIGTTITGLGLLITTDDAFNRATFIDDVRLTSFP